MFTDYDSSGLFDEMFLPDRTPRPHYSAVASRLSSLGATAFDRRRQMADLSSINQGITFTVYSDQRGVEKIFPFDLVPRIIPNSEWQTIERGLTQRINALNMFCHDIYHEQKIIKNRLIPC